MTQRYTAKDVRTVFAAFVEHAKTAGFNTDRWTLEEGNQFRNWSHWETDANGSGGLHSPPFRTDLGSTAREAYQTLSTRLDTLFAVAELKRKQMDRS